MTSPPFDLEAQGGFYKSTELVQLLACWSISPQRPAQEEHRGRHRDGIVTGIIVHHSFA